jgi:ribonuclease E
VISPAPEVVATEAVEAVANAAAVRRGRPTDEQTELPWPAEPVIPETASVDAPIAVEPEPPPVPANDVVAGPVVQPIVIGSESTPPLERKRGWWRRR